MGDVKTLDFFAYVSARYDVKREMYQGVANPIAIEVYHTAAHTYDVDDMIDSSKAGLAYYEKNFSPFQFRQYRILEYPALPHLRAVLSQHHSVFRRHRLHRPRREAHRYRLHLLRHRA